jgi:hypothetical protein
VPLVVLDPVVLVNTAKVPDGLSAKLLTLLAYGRANGYLNAGANAEAHWLQQWPPDKPLDVKHGWASMDCDAYAYTFAARKALAQSIPAQGRSSDLCLAISKTLIDRVVRRIGRLRDTEDLDLDAGIVAAAVSVHAARWITDDGHALPDYTATGDTDSNASIHTALRAGAPLVITKRADACEPDTPKMYYPIDPHQDYPLGATRAVHFDLLVHALCQDFDFHAIDARVLEQIAPTGPQRPKSPSATNGSSRPATSYARRN